MKSSLFITASAFSIVLVTHPAFSFELKGGEVGIGYSLYDVDELPDDLTQVDAVAKVDMAIANRFGVQLGVSYTELSYDDGSVDVSFDATGLDAHAYYMPNENVKMGVEIGYLDAGDLSIGGLGTFDVDGSVTTYGVEGMISIEGSALYGSVGMAEVENVSELDIVYYTLGYEYGATESFEVFGELSGSNFSIDGVADELDVTTVDLGVNYYMGPRMNVPVKLTASLGRSWLDYGPDSIEADHVAVGVNFLFGGTSNGSERDRLFDTFNSPL